MKIKYLLVVFVATSIIGCSSREPELEQVLKVAGDNRKELEIVLNHYSKDPADSLKYLAARHLIMDMAREKGVALYSPDYEKFLKLVYDSLDQASFFHSKDTTVNKWIRTEGFSEIWHWFARNKNSPDFKFDYTYDLRTISASLLIENVDYAFKAWELPWSKNYSFETFKEHILPYRYGNEVLTPWRKYYWDHFQFIIDSLKNEDDPFKVAVAINESMKPDFWGNEDLKTDPGGNQKPINLIPSLLVGDCEDQAGLGMCAMRSLGVATTKLIIPSWGKRPVGHSFTAIYSHLDNQWTDFHAGDINPGDNKTSGMPKVFMYEYWEDGHEKNRLHYYQSLKDVTAWFTNTVDLTFPVDDDIPKDEFLYLCTFDNNNWRPIMWANQNRGKITFKNMGTNMAYLPAQYAGDRLVPLSNPVTVDSSGHITEIKVQKTLQSARLLRKYTNDQVKVEARCGDMIGGRFQIASEPDFSDAQTIYTIDNCNSYIPQFKSTPAIKGRYVRYIFPLVERKFKDGPALLAFYSGNKKMTGKYLASEPVLDRYMDDLFDEDLLTYVSLLPAEEGTPRSLGDKIPFMGPTDIFWVGMDLGNVTEIDAVEYCPRNDKNNIYPGLVYELYYWNNEWISVGKQNAENYSLVYENLPSGALYLLKCHSEGQEIRIFTIDETGNQVWW